MIDLKAKLKKCELVCGMHTSLVDSSITELCGNVGYDFIWIDTEHTAIDLYTLETHIIAAKAANCRSLVRIPWNDAVLAKRVLEIGPDGIIFPVINTAKELDLAIKCTLYPPDGNRGFGPIRAANYGLTNIDDYIKTKSFELIRCVQIESYVAVDNLKEMVENPFVDCFIFGPCDLSGTLGELNNVFGKKTQNTIKQAIQVLNKAGKSIGISTGSDDPKILQHWYEMGINFISAGTDYVHIVNGSKKVLEHLRNLVIK